MLAALVLGAAVLGAAPAAAEAPRAELSNFFCQTAWSPLNRQISVTAVMRPEPGTERMELRFELLRRLPGYRRFEPVRGGDLGKWIHPNDPTLGQRTADVWKLQKQVAELYAPAVYRFRVTFRWIFAAVSQDSVLLSSRCAQT